VGVIEWEIGKVGGGHEKGKERSNLVVAVGRERREICKWRAKLKCWNRPYVDRWSPKPKGIERSEGE
jgi:hypothetical protein